MNTDHIDKDFYIKLFVFYNILILIRGIFDLESYEDVTTLLSRGIPIALFLPFSIYIGTNLLAVSNLLRIFFYYLITFSLLLLFSSERNLFDFAHTISPIYIFILVLPYLKKKYKVVVIIVALVSFFNDLTNRSNLLNITIAILIMSSFYLKGIVVFKITKIIRSILLFFPVFFLFLGVFNVFNIFKIGDFTSSFVIEDNRGQQDLFVDSRTSIYEDVFYEIDKKNAHLFGLGGSGKTETSLIEANWGDFDVIYKEGRRGTESGMLNYIQWGGALGGLIYFLLFVKSSYLGIYNSKNWLSVMLGLWLAYKALFSFIEDALVFNIYSLFIFIPMGLCFNKKFRGLRNSQIYRYVNFIFNK
ncbi:hypothetical protein [Maribacter sp. LLG6340-A2]|uniref:hypothetical protein n=1 Tax=Maribacter sp. LLG6340-A2 TaxID=3160834 RepID=UPI00386997C0